MDPAGSSFSSVRGRVVFQKLLTEAAAGLSFSPDADRDRTADRAPTPNYSTAHHTHLYTPSGALTPGPRTGFYKPAPVLKPPQAPRPLLEPDWLPRRLHPSESAHRPPARRRRPLLQDSTRENRVQPVHEEDRDLQQNNSKTTLCESGTTGSLNEDLVLTEPAAASDPLGPGADGSTDVDQTVELDGGSCRENIQRLLARVFHDDKPGAAQQRAPSGRDRDRDRDQDRPSDVQLIVSQLVALSRHTTQVRSLLAEWLNSPESERRLMVCEALCSLGGPVNKDVVDKLVQLMSRDLSEEVRLAAARTLLQLGKGQEVHHQLRLKLQGVCGARGRAAGLQLLSSLGLRTAELLQPLESCFRDESSSVRTLACQAAAALLLNDQTVERRLLEMIETDPIQDVRLSAIKAVGVLGLSSADVQEALQSCMEAAEEDEVRVAACRLLPDAGMAPEQLQSFLLQRLHEETNWLVRRTIKEMLQEDRDSDTQFIRLQVKRQGEWRMVADRVLLLEKLQAEKPAWFGLHPRVVARLLSQHQRTEPIEPIETTDEATTDCH